MAEINIPIQIKRGSYANWASQNPVLAAGQLGFEKDRHRLKCGDGVSNWNDLLYINDPVSMARAPLTSDNTYAVGQIWFDSSVAASKFYILKNILAGSAVWDQILTGSDITHLGLGDMTKSVYDTDNDGTVDKAAKLSPGATINGVLFDGSAPVTVEDSTKLPLTGGTMTGDILLPGVPASGFGAVSKSYVDAKAQGLDIKEPVRAATTEAIALTGFPVVDGVTLVDGDRILVKDQSDPKENGVYIVSSGSWARAADADTGAGLETAYFVVTEGSVNNGVSYACISKNITVGTNDIVFAEFSAAGKMMGGNGIDVSANVISIAEDANLPGAPTAPAGTSTTQIATTAFVLNELKGLVIDGGDLDP